MNQKEREKQEATERLREWLKPGDTVYTILRHVSRSGMQRRISIIIFKDDRPYQLDYNVAMALGYRMKEICDGIVVDGCGMDMGFHLIYELGRILWPGGDGKYTTGRNGMTEPETDGGYLLQHRWL